MQDGEELKMVMIGNPFVSETTPGNVYEDYLDLRAKAKIKKRPPLPEHKNKITVNIKNLASTTQPQH